jgi:hypothetical protein
MRRALIWLLLYFGCLFGCCPGIAAAEPSSREAGGSYDAGSYGALVDRLMTSDPRDWCVFGRCPRPAPPEPSGGSAASSYEAYADKVIAVGRKRELAGVSVYNYVGMPEFEKLVDASTESPELCVRFLSEKKYTEHQRLMAMLSMYKLSIEQRVAFVRNLATLRDRGLISPEELMSGLLPRLSTTVVFEHYQDTGIQSLLREMEARDDIGPSSKSQIRSILSGEGFARKRWIDFDRECMRWSQMRSIAACVSLATQILRVYAVSLMTR